MCEAVYNCSKILNIENIGQANAFIKRLMMTEGHFFAHSQVAAERRAIAAEYADTLRRLDAARTEMLQLKNK